MIQVLSKFPEFRLKWVRVHWFRFSDEIPRVFTENLNECKLIRGDWAAQKRRINLKYHLWSPLGHFPRPFPGANQPYWCARQMLGPNKDFLGWCCAAGNCPIYASNKYTGSKTGTQGPKQVHRVTNSYAGSQCQTFSAWTGNLLIRKLMWLIWRLTDPAAEMLCWPTMAPCLFCRVLSFNPDPILLRNISFFSTRQSLKCQPSQMVWHNNNMPSLISLVNLRSGQALTVDTNTSVYPGTALSSLMLTMRRFH